MKKVHQLTTATVNQGKYQSLPMRIFQDRKSGEIYLPLTEWQTESGALDSVLSDLLAARNSGVTFKDDLYSIRERGFSSTSAIICELVFRAEIVTAVSDECEETLSVISLSNVQKVARKKLKGKKNEDEKNILLEIVINILYACELAFLKEDEDEEN